MPDDFKNILIIKPSSLGDVVMALPAQAGLDAEPATLITDHFALDLPGYQDFLRGGENRLGAGWYSSAGAGIIMMDFELPLLPTGEYVSEVTLTMLGLDESQNATTLQVGGIFAPLSKSVNEIPWNGLLAEGALLGTGYAVDDHPDWNPAMAVVFDQLFGPFDAMGPGDSYGTPFPYTDNTVGDGLVKLIQDQISESTNETVIVTVGPGLFPREAVTYFQFCSNEEGNPNWRPLLEITTIPEPATIMLLSAAVPLLLRRKRS